MMNMSVQSFSIHTPHSSILPFFFFNDTATTEIYTLSLHDALPISPFPISILRNCLTRKSAAAPPESTTSRKQKHPSNYSRKKCATSNPPARKPSSPPTPAACCNSVPAPPSTVPTRRSSTSSNSSIEACDHENAKRRTARTLCFVTSLFLYFILSSSPKTATPLPQRWGLLRKGRAVFRREDCWR